MQKQTLTATQVNFLKFIKEKEVSRGRWVPEFVTPHTHFAIGAFACDDIMISVQEKNEISHLFTTPGRKSPRLLELTSEGEAMLGSDEIGI
ncbi:hypothetical protein phiOC_p343 [Ochrobactrum phage vB_OspM_OC]|nr:hypothetical protein phiOC_p343 [Ochrobactrum phage vB_OspM_OC]